MTGTAIPIDRLVDSATGKTVVPNESLPVPASELFDAAEVIVAFDPVAGVETIAYGRQELELQRKLWRPRREREVLRLAPAAVAAARAADRLRVLRIELPEHIPIAESVPMLVAACFHFKGDCDLREYQPATPVF